jgi:hypothetical protein
MPFIGDLIGLVVDPNHDQYGAAADLEANDWENGQLLVRFADGTIATLYDGQDATSTPRPPQVRKIDRRHSEAILPNIQVDLMLIRPKLRELWAVAEDESLSIEKRLNAKREIFDETAVFPEEA